MVQLIPGDTWRISLGLQGLKAPLSARVSYRPGGLRRPSAAETHSPGGDKEISGCECPSTPSLVGSAPGDAWQKQIQSLPEESLLHSKCPTSPASRRASRTLSGARGSQVVRATATAAETDSGPPAAGIIGSISLQNCVCSWRVRDRLAHTHRGQKREKA